jgi:hypothetical protein
MSPENLVTEKNNTKTKRQIQDLNLALDECIKIVNSLEKQTQIFVETKKITEEKNQLLDLGLGILGQKQD